MVPSSIDAMTVLTGVVELVRGIGNQFLIPGLRGLIRGFACGLQFEAELYPIGIGHGDKLAILTPAPRSQHELRGLRNGDCGIIDNVPSLVNIAAPDQPIETNAFRLLDR